jgi:hypothetical protein
VIQIDKNVPIPAPGGVDRSFEQKERSCIKYPWRQMIVGDSFFVPGVIARKFGGACVNAEKATGFRFCQRTTDGGVRVWRVA